METAADVVIQVFLFMLLALGFVGMTYCFVQVIQNADRNDQ